MSDSEKRKQKRTELVSFRLTKDEFRPYKLIVDETDLSKTELFRQVFLSKDLTFNVKENKPVDYNKLVFYFNKSSNNINQIAHNINSAYRTGVVSERIFTDTLNRLITIERLLKKGIDKC